MAAAGSRHDVAGPAPAVRPRDAGPAGHAALGAAFPRSPNEPPALGLGCAGRLRPAQQRLRNVGDLRLVAGDLAAAADPPNERHVAARHLARWATGLVV